MRDGAAKLLQASKSTRQSMEASKGLFVSNAKIIALMRELQQRQSGGGGNSGSRYIQCVCVCTVFNIVSKEIGYVTFNSCYV